MPDNICKCGNVISKRFDDQPTDICGYCHALNILDISPDDQKKWLEANQQQDK